MDMKNYINAKVLKIVKYHKKHFLNFLKASKNVKLFNGRNLRKK